MTTREQSPFRNTDWFGDAGAALVPLSLLFYLPLVLASGAWIVWHGGASELQARLFGSDPWGFMGLGLAVGFGVVVLWMGVEVLWGPARWMVRAFRVILGPLTPAQCLLLAAASSAGEEMFFRATLQPEVGLPAATLLFAVLHVPVHRALRPWPFFALGAGFLLGFLYQATESVIAPISAHFIINLVNLWRLTQPRRAAKARRASPR